MKYCKKCGLYMLSSFKGCPHCQTDKHIIIVEKYGDKIEVDKHNDN